MMLELIYSNGQLAALDRYKLGFPAPTNPAVATITKPTSPTLSSSAQQGLAPPSTPMGLAQIFDAHEQGETRSEPRRKLSADNLCTSCRRVKHYGKCSQPRTIPEKAADFNMGMLGSSPAQSEGPATSANYHSAVSSISALTRAMEGRPADEQAASGFADLFRHQGIRDSADQPGRMYGGLNKTALSPIEAGIVSGVAPTAAAGLVNPDDTRGQIGAGLGGALGGTLLGTLANTATRSRFPGAGLSLYGLGGQAVGTALGGYLGHQAAHKLADFMLPGTGLHSMHEQRGPSVNPYEEQRTRLTPPVGFGDEGLQRINRAFGQIDHAADTANIGGGFGDPEPGPAVLG